MEPLLNSKWPKSFDSVPNLDPPPKVAFDFIVFDYEERDELIDGIWDCVMLFRCFELPFGFMVDERFLVFELFLP